MYCTLADTDLFVCLLLPYLFLRDHNIAVSFYWAIPENIRTIPRTAFRNSEGKGGFLELEIRRHGGILTSGILKAWGGLDLGFTQETDKNVSLESAFLRTF